MIQNSKIKKASTVEQVRNESSATIHLSRSDWLTLIGIAAPLLVGAIAVVSAMRSDIAGIKTALQFQTQYSTEIKSDMRDIRNVIETRILGAPAHEQKKQVSANQQ